MHGPAYRILVTLTAVIVAGVLLTQTLDVRGQQYTDEALKRSLITFGVARALNAAISVAQGTEVALQPAGVGITLTPGQVLDPINDLVERFSWVMLAASAALGMLKLLLTISAWPWFDAMIIVVLGICTALVWLPRTREALATHIALKVAVVLVALRLAAPLVAVASEGVYDVFLAPRYEEATEQLDRTTSEVGRINEDVVPMEQTEGSIWESAQRFYEAATSQFEIEARIDAYKEAVADASLHLVNLIAVFLLQTVLLPLIFLFLFYQLVRQLLGSMTRDR